MLEITEGDAGALPLDELAIRVLADYRGQAGWNKRNWLLENEGQPRSAPRSRILAEAWGWLEAKCLVAWDPSQDAPDSRFITRRGLQVLERGLDDLRAVERLDVDLVDVLEVKARPQFLRGDFETAVFIAFKEVEIRVREMTGSPDSLIGAKLMQHALAPGGALARLDAEPGEVVAEMELYRGAIGLFKNPASHRAVDYASSTTAAEAVLLADLLLRLLDRPTPAT